MNFLDFYAGWEWTYHVSLSALLGLWLSGLVIAAASRRQDARTEFWTPFFIGLAVLVQVLAAVVFVISLMRRDDDAPRDPNRFPPWTGTLVLLLVSLLVNAALAALLVWGTGGDEGTIGVAAAVFAGAPVVLYPLLAPALGVSTAVPLSSAIVTGVFLLFAVAATASERRSWRVWGVTVFLLHLAYALTMVVFFVSRDQLRFFRPEALWLLALLPVFVFLWWRSQALLEGARATAALVFRLLLLVALTVAAAEPQVVQRKDDMAVIFVVDRSLSMPGQLLHDWYSRYIEEKLEQIPPDRRTKDYAAVIVHAGDPALVRRLDTEMEVRVVEPDDLDSDVTDIAAAIRQALAIFPDDKRKRIVLLTDGNENRGDTIADLRLAQHYGVTIDVVEIRAEAGEKKDVRIERLDQPGEVRLGQRFEPRLVIWASEECEAKLIVKVNGVPESMPPDVAAALELKQQQLRELESQPVPDAAAVEMLRAKIAELESAYPPAIVRLKPGRNWPVLPARRYDQPGFYELSVELEVDPSVDHVPENNSGSAFTVVRGQRRLLVVHGDTLAENETFLSELRAVFDVRTANEAPPTIDVVDPTRMPRELAEWRLYDCVILSNVSAADWKEDQQRKLVTAINRFGTGLVMIGGDRSYGAGGYRDQPIVDALPVRMEIEEREAMLTGALVIVLHTCEFPEWNTHTKAMCQAALDALSDHDELGIVLYDWNTSAGNTGASWLFKLQPIAGQRAYMKTRIQSASPGDMPSFGPAFGLAYGALEKSGANSKHCIVISDGDPSQPRYDLVSGSFKTFGITTSAIVVQPHMPSTPPGPEQMTMIKLAQNGGNDPWQDRYYEILTNARLGLLPQIFTREAVRIRTSLVRNGIFRPIVTNQAEFLQGILAGGGGIPDFGGFVAVTPKALAQQALRLRPVDDESAAPQPLLVYWQHGLGRVVCFTSDVTNPGWCAGWSGDQWSDYRRFWGDIINWSARQARADDDRVTMHTGLVDGRGHVIVDANDNGLPLVLDSPVVTVVDPDGRVRQLPLRLLEPGRYEAWFDAPDRGSWQVHMLGEVRAAGEGEAEAVPVVLTGGLSVPYAREFRDLSSNTALLNTIAWSTGGKFVRGSLVPVAGLRGVRDEAAPERLFADDVLVNPERNFEALRDPEGQPVAYNPFADDLPVAFAFTPIWQPFAIAACLLLFVDVFFRKVFVSWTQVTESLAPSFAAVPLVRSIFVVPDEVPLEEMERLRSVKARVAGRQQSERERRAAELGDVLAQLRDSGRQADAPAPPAAPAAKPAATPPAKPAVPPADDGGLLKRLREKAKEASASAAPPSTPAMRPPGSGAPPAGPKSADQPPAGGGGGLFDRLRDAKKRSLDDRDEKK